MGNLKDKFLSLEPTEVDKIRDKRTALVDGVYMFNHPIRKKTLSYIWAKYNMLPDMLTDSLGRLYEISKDVYLPEKNYKSLFDYTHDKTSVYSHSIAEKNLTVKGENGNSIVTINNSTKDSYIAWHDTQYAGSNYYDIITNHINDNIINRYYVSKNNKEISENSINYELSLNDRYADIENRLNEISKPQKPKAPQRGKFPTEESYNEAKAKYSKELASYKQNLRIWKDSVKGRRSEVNNEINNLEDKLSNYSNKPINLIGKTSKLFLENKIETLVDKFYGGDDDLDYIDSAKIKGYGNSHGRSLLKKNNKRNEVDENGYINPFCRVWAFHHQYGKGKNTLIRNSGYIFSSEDKLPYRDYSVLKDGFVRITPEKKGEEYNTKSCMFSIENLAWKDVNRSSSLSIEQQGPNGGRIMWFPPYNLKFQENVNVNWNPTTFIGRGENIYTYTNTDRMGTLSFTMLIDYPSVMDNYFNVENSEEKEQEILRFFAGCDTPSKIGKTEENTNTESLEPKDEETIKVDEENANKLSFSVYFPHNYSGYDDKKDNTWVSKLIYGINNTIDNSNMRGYEMLENDGISNTQFTGFICVVNGKNVEYFYPIDKNECFIKKQEKFYKDKKSYSLNSVESKQKNCSFGDIYYMFNVNNINDELNNHFKKCNIINSENKVVNNLVREICDKKNLGSCIIKVTGVKEKISGSEYVNFDLASKRCENVKKYLLENLHKIGGNIDSDISISYIEEEVTSNINDFKNKKARRVDVEILYNLPKTENKTSSDVQRNRDNKTENYEPHYTVKKESEYKKHNEADYFSQLRDRDNFLYEKIVEKVKYFEPAYHSINPEGFNSRLNFLHQCTRQGHTIERKSDNVANITSTAWNMSFGRPPVCVLRIGDFINTKILIQSLSITYENNGGIQWDLNPEGAGVQPMFANITLGIILIGGQSINTPIERLNNAVSFNYYANTKLYDERADFGLYKEEQIKHDKFYIPEIKTQK